MREWRIRPLAYVQAVFDHAAANRQLSMVFI
jgi:hypothetical protein